MRLDQLKAMLDASPNDAFLLFAVAKEYEKSNDLPTALVFYRRLQETDPQYVGLYYHLGKLLEALERPSEALEAYDTGISIAQQLGDRHAWSELAAARMELDETT